MHMHDSVQWVLDCKLNLAFSAICKVTTSKFTAKLSLCLIQETIIKLSFVIVSHNTFFARLFGAPLPAAPRGNCPPLPPLSYATDHIWRSGVCCRWSVDVELTAKTYVIPLL